MFDLLKINIVSLAIITNLIIGFLAVRGKFSNPVNRFLGIFSLVFAIWAGTLYLYENPFIFDSLFWIKATYSVVVFGIIGCMFYFAYIFPDGKTYPPLQGQVGFLSLAILIEYILLFTDKFVRGVSLKTFGPATDLGSFYLGFIIYCSIFGFWGLIVLIKKYKSSIGLVKSQLKFLFMGLFLFVLTTILLDSILPLLYGDTRYFSISSVGSLFFVGCTAYSIIMHRLLDIRLITGRIVVNTLLISFLVSLMEAGAVSYWLITKTPIRPGVLLVVIVVALIIVLIYDKLNKLASNIASRFLFQSVYDYQKTLLDATLGLSKYLDVSKLAKVVTNSLEQAMRSDRAVILVRDFNTNYYKIETSYGFEERDCLNLVYNISVVSYLEGSGEIVILEEINHIISETENEVEKTALEKLRSQMKDSQVSVIIPILKNGVMISVILLGDKISKDAYSVQDVDLLKTIATQSAVAFENARLYKEVTSFNEELKLKIQDATSNLQKVNLRLKQLDKLKDDFVSMASHELRTPMTAIKSYIWMALSHSDIPLSLKLKNYLTKILVSTERLIHLVNDMLNISRIESGKVEVKPEIFSIKELVKEVIEEVNLKAKEKNITLGILDSSQVPQVFADPEKIMQVVLNLVGNSLKFTPNGGKISISFFSDGEMLDVSISDNGVGIAKDDLSKLFTKFGRLDNSYIAAATSGGTGLGLYICKSLIELSKGKIWVESDGVGRGATFKFSIPIASEKVIENVDSFSNLRYI